MYFRLKFNNNTNKFTIVDSVSEINLEDNEYLYATKEQLNLINKKFVTNYNDFIVRRLDK